MYELAQVNIARLQAAMDSPQLADFVDALDPINALADTAPGFRWRLQTEDGNATAIRGFETEIGDGIDVITNMSTWADVESLAGFVYGPMHSAIMRRRREWFLPIREAYTVCWWVPEGHRPTIREAEIRLDLLRELGVTPAAFTIKRHFPSPDVTSGDPAIERDDWTCGV